MAHRGRQETLHFTWVTESTARPRKRGKGTLDDQAYGSEQTSFLEPGSWPHKSTAIVITSRAPKQQSAYRLLFCDNPAGHVDALFAAAKSNGSPFGPTPSVPGQSDCRRDQSSHWQGKRTL